MMNRILFLMIALSANLLFAQKGTIAGTVRSAADDGSVIEYASVALLKADGTVVSGGMTSGKGTFLLENLPFGSYRLAVSYIGFTPYTKENVQLTASQPKLTLGNILLQPATTTIDTVTVSAQKNLIENQPDKRVFNVAQATVNMGGTAMDALQMIPSVTMSQDGNVQMRGSENVTILINGRPTSVQGGDRSAILSQIPVGNIESVEIITNPSARYDAEGSTGILNIVLKKDKGQGFNGNSTLSLGSPDPYYGSSPKYNGNVTINYRGKKMSGFASLAHRDDSRYNKGSANRSNYFDDTTRISQYSAGLNRNITPTARVGVDFFPNKNNTFSLNGAYSPRWKDEAENIRYNLFKRTDVFNYGMLRNSDVTETGGTVDGNISYKHVFGETRREWSADATYSRTMRDNVSDFSQDLTRDASLLQPLALLHSDQKTTLNSATDVLTLQTDYIHPLRKDSRFEAGAKSILRSLDNNFASQSRYTANGDAWKPDVNLTNHFVYNDQVYSLYGMYFGKWQGIQYNAGLRSEYTRYQPKLLTTNQSFDSTYLLLFPSAFLSKKIKDVHEIRFNYSTRINRPGPQQLNPFSEYTDALNLRYGNPYLRPEYAHALEASYVKSGNRVSFTVTGYARFTRNQIMRIRTVDSSGVAAVLFQNINRGQNFGVEGSSRIQITKGWDATVSGNMYQVFLNATNISNNLTNQALAWSAKLLMNMKLGNIAQLQFNGSYQAPIPIPQGKLRPIYGLDMSIKRDLLKRKAEIALSVSDVFNTRQFGIDMSDVNYLQEFTRKSETRIATVSFTYRFGRGDAPKRQPKLPQQQEQMDMGF